MKNKNSSVADADVIQSLGLSHVPVPATLTLSRKDKIKRKFDAKKEKQRVIRDSIQKLAETKKVVQDHRDYVKAVTIKEKAEKKVRQRKTKAEQIKSRRERDEKIRAEGVKSIQEFLDVDEARNKLGLKPLRSKRVGGNEDYESSADEAVQAEHRDASNTAFEIEFSHVEVNRTEKIEQQRQQLPAIRYEQEVMEAVKRTMNTSCVIVCGETGSGKTTQIPQFLWEHGLGAMIGVTQPRRVAAFAMASRVCEELNAGELGRGGVGYQVRYHKQADVASTKLKFMTEGILLREVQEDFALMKYKAIVLDEAHERSVTMDVLLGLLSRIVPMRAKLGKPLCVIVMSATLRVADFTENSYLYKVTPKVINIEARTYPVSAHYSLRTSTRATYLQDAKRKIIQIHTKLPPGGIVCFVPTQRDCETLTAELLEYFSNTPTRQYDDAGFRAKANAAFSRKAKHEKVLESVLDEEERRRRGEVSDDEDEDEKVYELSDDEKENGDDEDDQGEDLRDSYDTLYCLPLYSNLPLDRQNLVFQDPPAGTRLCVIATNVAETSITIPLVRYVVDTGLVKEKVYEPEANIHKYRMTWVSQSSANQRCGRAGRVAPGHCYRLFTPGTFSTFEMFPCPEIMRTPLESVVLMMKQFGIQKVERFPFPTPPPKETFDHAILSLRKIGALENKEFGAITSFGCKLLEYPVVPRYAAMLLYGVESQNPLVKRCIIDAVAVAATVVDPFLLLPDLASGENNNEEALRRKMLDQLRQELQHPGSDFLSYAKALRGYRHAKGFQGKKQYCEKYKLMAKFMKESAMLSDQLRRHIDHVYNVEEGGENQHNKEDDTNDSDPDENEDGDRSHQQLVDEPLEDDMTPQDEALFRKIVCRGLVDCVARIATSTECHEAGVRAV
eukprot:PhF_6_TR8262/c2_g1_i2/m.12576/K14780/DHX37, DHR1; ATP-dependent RNA helicase DHX37/DHR1